jgi:hypothetical protein
MNPKTPTQNGYIHTYALSHNQTNQEPLPTTYKKIPVCNIGQMLPEHYFVSYFPTKQITKFKTVPNTRPYIVYYSNLFNPIKSSKTLDGAIKLMRKLYAEKIKNNKNPK